MNNVIDKQSNEQADNQPAHWTEADEAQWNAELLRLVGEYGEAYNALQWHVQNRPEWRNALSQLRLVD